MYCTTCRETALSLYPSARFDLCNDCALFTGIPCVSAADYLSAMGSRHPELPSGFGGAGTGTTIGVSSTASGSESAVKGGHYQSLSAQLSVPASVEKQSGQGGQSSRATTITTKETPPSAKESTSSNDDRTRPNRPSHTSEMETTVYIQPPS
ncbi:hypothetical protein FGG08_003723 [Glutinoglossum americanum]|uniref:Uncharacterized protein n=1 Tax=Glutinoglossum americanum TaxID=1670608 RepID=A0A9P8L382_9PEZI|nr:hypothetical protein FGG08_003723 [Glutinoglossum americanum]